MARSFLRYGLAAACVAWAVPAWGTEDLAAGDPATLLELDDSYITGLDQATALAFTPDGRVVLTQKTGEVKVRTTDGMVLDAGTISVDSSSEKGLLNVLPHPDFATNHLLFFYYSQSGGIDDDRNRVVTIPLGDNNMIDTASETVIVKDLHGPANHDGGALTLSPDNQYLYIGAGDTGCNSGTGPGTIGSYYGTCLTNGNGKVLRVKLNGDIPTDNPLVGVATVAACGGCKDDPSTLAEAAPRTDIWAWGFRNPWRIWADPQTGYVWVGDVGEVTYEEINIVPPEGGKHYGYTWREGGEGQDPSTCAEFNPDGSNCVDPNYYCHHGGETTVDGQTIDGNCTAITGGFIVDDCSWPDQFRGHYFFGDTDSDRIWTLEVTPDRHDVVKTSRQEIVQSDQRIVSFASGPDGALYYVAHSGHISRIAPKDPIACSNGGTGGTSSTGGNGGTSSSSGGAVNGGAVTTGGTGGGSAGVTSAGGSSSGGVGKAGSSTAGSGTSGSSDNGGCGCRVDHSNGPRDLGALLAAALGVMALRRRRAH